MLIESAKQAAIAEVNEMDDAAIEHWEPTAWMQSLHELPHGLATVIMHPLASTLPSFGADDSDKARRLQLAT